MDITKFSQEELCEAYDVLNGWGWYEKFGEKPTGFDEMPNYRRTFIEKVFHVPSKEDYIGPFCKAIKSVVPEKELLRYHHIHNLGTANEEFETWWFLQLGGCFSGRSFEYFAKLPGQSLRAKSN